MPRKFLPVEEHHEVGHRLPVLAIGADLPHQIHAERVAAQRKEQSVAERQDAGVAPDQIHRDRDDRKAHDLAEQRDPVGGNVKGAVRADGEIEDRKADEDHCCKRKQDRPAFGSVKTTVRQVGAHDSSALPLTREHALWPLLNEHDDEDEHRDLREYRALPCFKQLVGESESERGINRSGQLPHTAEHDHHERVDDVVLAQIGPDVADLRKRAAGEARDAGAEPERPHVDACGRHADAGRHLAVLRHAAHKQAEPRLVQQQIDQKHDGERKADDHDAAPRQHHAGQQLDAA